MPNREMQKDQRRQDILWAGLDLFVKKGYSATKISDIAKAANMSVGLMFHYFDSKEKLYETLITMGLEGTQALGQSGAVNPLDFFRGFTVYLLQSIREQPWMSKMFVLMAQAQRSGSTPEQIRKTACKVDTMRLSAEIIRQGQAAGVFRSGDPLALSSTFWSSIQGIMEQLVAVPSTPLPEADWLMDILTGGICEK